MRKKDKHEVREQGQRGVAPNEPVLPPLQGAKPESRVTHSLTRCKARKQGDTWAGLLLPVGFREEMVKEV